MAGYSGTPLAKKLGIKPGFRVKTKGAPTNYARLLALLPDDVAISSRFRNSIELRHLFIRSRSGRRIRKSLR